MTRAAIYARLSVDDGENTSIDTQLRVCRERAQAEGFTVVATYTDSNISGGVPPHLRPEGAQLIAARDAHKFDALVVSEPTRLYRSDALPAELRRWEAEGVRVVFAGGEIDMQNDEWELSAGMHGIIGQHFRRMISKKTHAALASRALRRSWTGGKPYGYDLSESDGRKVLVVNKHADLVREIYERFVKGESCNDIARVLNKRQVPSPGSTWNRSKRRHQGWLESTVRVILQNPIYTGTVRWNTSNWKLSEKDGKHKRTERPSAQWDRYTYQEEAYRVVNDKLWADAQGCMKGRQNPDKRLKSGGKAVYRLSGLLKCGVCGNNFVVDSGTHYACTGSKSQACTNTIRQRRDQAEHYILGAIDRQLLDPKLIMMMGKEIERELNRRSAALQNARWTNPRSCKRWTHVSCDYVCGCSTGTRT